MCASAEALDDRAQDAEKKRSGRAPPRGSSANLSERYKCRNEQQARRACLTQEGYLDHREMKSYGPGGEGFSSAARHFASSAK
jgi:hypothetical protein